MTEPSRSDRDDRLDEEAGRTPHASPPTDHPGAERGAPGRRAVLRGSALALGGAGLGWAGAASARPRTTTAPGTSPTVAAALDGGDGEQLEQFHGAYQAGITTEPQSHLSLIGLDLRPGRGREDLARLLRLLSDDAARLTAGLPALADTEPELASAPSRLTVTFGLGPRLVTEMVPAGRAPALRQLPAFANDRLQDRWGQTDLVLQIGGDDLATVDHARRMLVKDSRRFAVVRWVQNGFRRARGSVPAGTTMRNVMGQVDGTVNLDPASPEFTGLVWADAPLASAGATTLVVRRIKADLDGWDKVGREGRELAMGRRLSDGSPLTGTAEHDEPDFEARDAVGLPVIDPASHVRRARSDDPEQRFLRRSYNFTVGLDDGREESGLVFLAYAKDAERQFVPIQARLAMQDRLNEWTETIGSAVYLLPPGAPQGGYVGESLVTA